MVIMKSLPYTAAVLSGISDCIRFWNALEWAGRGAGRGAWRGAWRGAGQEAGLL